MAKKSKASEVIEVPRALAVQLAEELGSKSANKWPDKRLLDFISKEVPEDADEDTEDSLESDETRELFGTLMKAFDDEAEVTLIADEDEDEDEEPAAKKGKKGKKEEPTSKKGKKGKPSKDEDEDEDEDEEPAPKKGKKGKSSKNDEDAPPASKKGKKGKPSKSDEDDEDEDSSASDEDDEPKKGKKGKSSSKGKKEKSGGNERPGVIAAIIEVLKTGTKKEPVSKETILKTLVKKFPDREAAHMKATINVQVPHRLRSQKNMNIQKNENGYWISKN